ncbi:hypothetical protein RF11_13059 [Thelohanellus kitauei]|uniref:Uncharacterized protein n=1 Tax=Thelohanellus kitauei TaxID=669202 RepID=A0A0C2JKB1_THEKT|nr:hypothetical protein RF11_13059 [Thelohanellus kitauei]
MNPARHQCLYNAEWELLFPIKAVESDNHAFYCETCARTFSCGNSGISRVRRHCGSSRHIRMVSRQKTSSGNRESLSDKLLKSPSIKAISKRKLGKIKSTRNMKGSNNLQKMSKKRIHRNTNKQSDSFKMNDDRKVIEILEKCKNAYRLDKDASFEIDLELDIVEYFDKIVNFLNEGNSFKN